MRYRSFGDGGQSISALLVSVDSHEDETLQDGFLADCLDVGVNAFEARLDDLHAIQALGRGLASVERSMVVVGLRAVTPPAHRRRDLSREMVVRLLQDALRNTGLRWIDYLIIDDPEPDELDHAFFMTIEAARQAKRLRYVGVGGDGQTINDLIDTGHIQLYAAPYSLTSNQSVRKRLRQGESSNLMILGYDYYPQSVRQAQEAPAATGSGILSFLGFGGSARAREASGGPYDFLNHVRNWSPEQICLAYALNEPAISAVRIGALDVQTIKGLVEAVERELPNGLAAQIELARMSNAD